MNPQCVLVHTTRSSDHTDFLKRVRPDEWKEQHKNRKPAGKSCLGELEDGLVGLSCCSDGDTLLAFSEDGRAFMLQALDVPLVKKLYSPGCALTSLLPLLGDGHKVTALVPISDHDFENHSYNFLVFVTQHGLAKKVLIENLRGLRAGKSICCMKLCEGDQLRWVHRAEIDYALVCGTKLGNVIRCSLGNWSCSTVKGSGFLVSRLRDDQLVSVVVHKMSPEEAGCSGATNSLVSNCAHGQELGDARNEEGEDRDEDDAVDTGNSACEDVDAMAEAASSQCLLIVTRAGMGLRIPLSSARLRLNKRGCVPKRVMRTRPDDPVTCISIVSGKNMSGKPKVPKTPFSLWYAEHGCDPILENDMHGLRDEHEIRRNMFNRLPEAELQVYRSRAAEDQCRHEEEMVLFKKDSEEVLMGMTNGQVGRTAVASIPILASGSCKGKSITKCELECKISSITVLPSLDGQPEPTVGIEVPSASWWKDEPPKKRPRNVENANACSDIRKL